MVCCSEGTRELSGRLEDLYAILTRLDEPGRLLLYNWKSQYDLCCVARQVDGQRFESKGTDRDSEGQRRQGIHFVPYMPVGKAVKRD